MTALLSADADEVQRMVEEVDAYRRHVTPALNDLLETEPRSLVEQRRHMHARIALVADDDSQVDPLLEELLRPTLADVRYAGIIVAALKRYETRVLPGLWDTLHDTRVADSVRFRAGLALSEYVPESESWTDEDDCFLAEHLVSSDPEGQPQFRSYLRPRYEFLLPHLVTIFRDGQSSEQVAAARGIVDYAGHEIELVEALILDATPQQYNILYPLLGILDGNARRRWLDLMHQEPVADLPTPDRVALGKRRADAGITLLRQGNRDEILDIFRINSDPESLSQFVHRYRARGVTPEELIECLDRADVARQQLTGVEREMEDRVVFGLLLALGEYRLNEMPTDRQESLISRIHGWHATDPSSGIHGACGWLLRHWGHEDLAREVDRTPTESRQSTQSARKLGCFEWAAGATGEMPRAAAGRSARRSSHQPGSRYTDIGFRLAFTPSTSAFEHE